MQFIKFYVILSYKIIKCCIFIDRKIIMIYNTSYIEKNMINNIVNIINSDWRVNYV